MAKVNVYIPDGLLEQVDADARSGLRSRSSIVQEALAEYVSTSRKAEREAERRAGDQEALRIIREALASSAEHDPNPEFSAGEFLRGLRDADDDATDEEIVEMILARKDKNSDADD